MPLASLLILLAMLAPIVGTIVFMVTVLFSKKDRKK